MERNVKNASKIKLLALDVERKKCLQNKTAGP